MPSDATIAMLAEDYRNMQEMLFGDKIPFGTIMREPLQPGGRLWDGLIIADVCSEKSSRMLSLN